MVAVPFLVGSNAFCLSAPFKKVQLNKKFLLFQHLAKPLFLQRLLTNRVK